MTRLRSCEGCARHVFVTETHCPFCQQALAPVARAPIFDIRAGMSRAQRYTLVAAVATQTLLACSSNSKSDSQDGNTQQGSGGATMQGTGGGQRTGGSGGGSGQPQPFYGNAFPPGTGGMPVEPDAGVDTDTDAGK